MILISNKKARYDFDINKTFYAGIVLSGAEVKSLRLRHGSLSGSYIKIIGGELFLINAQVSPYSFADQSTYDPKQTRKLLVKKKELQQLQDSVDQKKVILVPLSIDLKHNLIKVKVAVGRGLKKFEKRQKLKKRDQDRDLAREVKYG